MNQVERPLFFVPINTNEAMFCAYYSVLTDLFRVWSERSKKNEKKNQHFVSLCAFKKKILVSNNHHLSLCHSQSENLFKSINIDATLLIIIIINYINSWSNFNANKKKNKQKISWIFPISKIFRRIKKHLKESQTHTHTQNNAYKLSINQ